MNSTTANQNDKAHKILYTDNVNALLTTADDKAHKINETDTVNALRTTIEKVEKNISSIKPLTGNLLTLPEELDRTLELVGNALVALSNTVKNLTARILELEEKERGKKCINFAHSTKHCAIVELLEGVEKRLGRRQPLTGNELYLADEAEEQLNEVTQGLVIVTQTVKKLTARVQDLDRTHPLCVERKGDKAAGKRKWCV